MPNYKTHLLAGGAVFGSLWYTGGSNGQCLAIPAEFLPVAAALALLGSIFPDIDVPSKMQRIFYIGAFITLLFALLTHNQQLFSLLGLTAFVVATLTHRTTTHNPLFLVSLPLALPLYFTAHHPHSMHFAFVLYFYFVGGCLSHVLLDRSMTKIKKLARPSWRGTRR